MAMSSMANSASSTMEHVWIWDTKARSMVAALRHDVKHSGDVDHGKPSAMVPCPGCAGSDAADAVSSSRTSPRPKFPSLKSTAQAPSRQSSSLKSLCSWLKNMLEPLASMSQLPDYLKFAQESLYIQPTMFRNLLIVIASREVISPSTLSVLGAGLFALVYSGANHGHPLSARVLGKLATALQIQGLPGQSGAIVPTTPLSLESHSDIGKRLLAFANHIRAPISVLLYRGRLMHFTSDWKNLTILEQFIIIAVAVRHLLGAHSFKQSLTLLDSSPHMNHVMAGRHVTPDIAVLSIFAENSSSHLDNVMADAAHLFFTAMAEPVLATDIILRPSCLHGALLLFKNRGAWVAREWSRPNHNPPITQWLGLVQGASVSLKATRTEIQLSSGAMLVSQTLKSHGRTARVILAVDDTVPTPAVDELVIQVINGFLSASA